MSMGHDMWLLELDLNLRRMLWVTFININARVKICHQWAYVFLPVIIVGFRDCWCVRQFITFFINVYKTFHYCGCCRYEWNFHVSHSLITPCPVTQLCDVPIKQVLPSDSGVKPRAKEKLVMFVCIGTIICKQFKTVNLYLALVFLLNGLWSLGEAFSPSYRITPFKCFICMCMYLGSFCRSTFP